jgi:hypothetical protein
LGLGSRLAVDWPPAVRGRDFGVESALKGLWGIHA